MAKQKPEMTQEQEDELRKNPINVFLCGCDECKDKDAVGFEEFKHHLFQSHKLKHDQLKGKKQMMMHMDGTQWHSSTYKWTLETGLEFTQFTKHARSLDDPMRFEY